LRELLRGAAGEPVSGWRAIGRCLGRAAEFTARRHASIGDDGPQPQENAMSSQDFVAPTAKRWPLLDAATAVCVVAILVGVTITASPLSARNGDAAQPAATPVIAVATYNMPPPAANAKQEELPATF
jgi:hypothetical protein